MQKKNLPSSPVGSESSEGKSLLDGFTSESVPGISESLKNRKQEILQERTQGVFYDNPLFKPLKEDGSVNPNWEKNREVFLEHTGQIPNEEQRTLYNTPILPGIKGTSAKDIVEAGGDLVKGAAEGVNTGLEKITTGAKTLVGALGGQTGSYKKKAEELTKGVLEVGTGVAETGFSGATVVMPEFAALVGGADLIKKAAHKNLPEHEAEFISTAVDVPFASVSIMADKLGFDAKEHPNWAMAMEIGDLVAMVGGHAAYNKAKAGGLPVPTPVKSMKDLQALSKEVAEGKASPEKKAQLEDIIEATAEVTPAEMHKAAKEKGTAESVDIADKIEQTQTPVEEPVSAEVADLNKKIEDLESETKSDVIDEAIEGLKKERDAVIESDNLVDIKLAEAEAKVSELKDKQVQLEKLQGEAVTEAGKEAYAPAIESVKKELSDIVEPKLKDRVVETPKPKQIDPEISNFVEPKREVKPKTVKELEDRMFEIEDIKTDEASAEFNSLEKELEAKEWDSVFESPLEDVSAAVDKLIAKDKDMPNGYGSFIEKRDAREVKDIVDRYSDPSKLSDREVVADFVSGLEGSPATWYADGLKLREAAKEANKRGIPLERMVEKIKRKYTADGYDELTANKVVAGFMEPLLKNKKLKKEVKQEVIEPLVDEKRADYKAEKEGVKFESEEELDRYVAEDSESPAEVAETYLRDEAREKAQVDEVDKIFDEQGIKISEEDFREHGTPDDLKDPTLKKFIDETAEGIDKQLKDIGEIVGREVTADEYINYIKRKQEAKFTPKETELKTKLRSKYKELTGKDLTPSVAKSAIESVKKETKEIVAKEGAKSEKLKTESDEAIAKEKPVDHSKKKDIGVSEEARKKQRKELGIPEPKKVKGDKDSRSWEELNSEANRMVESGEVDPLELAREINKGKKDSSSISTAVLNRGVVDIDKKITNARYERRGAVEMGDKSAEKKAADEWFASVSELAEVHKALEKRGSKMGEEFAALKMSKIEDYSLGNLHETFKKANGDKPLPREVLERIDEYAVEIAELDVKIKEQEAQIKKQGLDIEELKNRKVSSKERVAKIRKDRSKLFDDWKKSREDTKEGPVKQGSGIGDKDIEFAAKIAMSYLEEGVVTTMAVSKKLKRDAKELLGVKLSDKDVADILDSKIDGEQIRKNFDDVELAKKLTDNKRRREKAKEKVRNEKATIEYANKTKSDKIIEGVIDAANVPRSLMASFDFSAPLRQGLVATVAHPKSGAKAFKEMFKQAFSQKNFDNWLIDYKMSPEYSLAKKSDLYVADPKDLHSGLKAKEEAFMSNFAEKIPFGVGEGIKMSERAYVGYLNKLRTDVFKNGAEELMAQGKTFEKNPESFKAWAEFVNNSTGRGKLPTETLEKAAPALNAAFFSPRLIASRINTLNPRYYAKMPPEVRVKALKDMGKFVGLATSVLGLLKASGADVEVDPRSSDFGKVRDGNTRYDVLGGYQQYLRVATQFAMAEKKSTTTGRISKLNPYVFPNESRWDLLGRFARYKLSPSMGLVVNVLSGKDPMGLPTTLKGQAYSNLTPLQLQGALEAYDDGGMDKVIKTVVPSMFGIGVQTYDSRKSSLERKRALNRAIKDY